MYTHENIARNQNKTFKSTVFKATSLKIQNIDPYETNHSDQRSDSDDMLAIKDDILFRGNY